MDEDRLIIEIQDHGLILEEIVEDEHYVLGGFSDIFNRFGDEKLMPGGHGWGEFKPDPEYQSIRVPRLFDSRNCTGYATLNALETLAKRHGFEDFPHNCSERYTGIMAGTTTGGNNPHTVIESVRNDAGVIPDVVLPWSNDIHDELGYYAPNPMPEEYVSLGRRILAKFDIGHEWALKREDSYEEKARKLIEALEKGTVCVSTKAWKKDRKTGLYTKAQGESDNHWVQLLDYVEGEYWVIYDHYDTVEKKLEWEYDFLMAKVYYIKRKTPVEPEPVPEPVEEYDEESEPTQPVPEVVPWWLSLLRAIYSYLKSRL